MNLGPNHALSPDQPMKRNYQKKVCLMVKSLNHIVKDLRFDFCWEGFDLVKS